MISSRKKGWGLSVGVIAVALAALQPGAAQARSHHRHHGGGKTEAAPASTKPTLVASYGDWGAYLAQGKSKVCYALAQPKDRSPSSLKKDQAYIFISNRPAEHVRNEVSVIMGVPLKDGAAQARAEVGATSFELVTKGQNAWMKNAADEQRFLDVVKKSSKMIVKGTLV